MNRFTIRRTVLRVLLNQPCLGREFSCQDVMRYVRIQREKLTIEQVRRGLAELSKRNILRRVAVRLSEPVRYKLNF